MKGWFKERKEQWQLRDVLPSITTVAATPVVPYLLQLKPGAAYLSRFGVVGELVSAGLVAGPFVVYVLVCERAFLKECYYMLRPSSRAFAFPLALPFTPFVS